MDSRYLQLHIPNSNLEWRSSAYGQHYQTGRRNSKRVSVASVDSEVAAFLNATSVATRNARGSVHDRKRARGVAVERPSKGSLEFQGTVAGHRSSNASYRIAFTPYPPATILESSSRPTSPNRPLPPTPSHHRTTSISSDTSFSSSQSSSSSSRFEKSLPPPPPTAFKTHSRSGSASSGVSIPRRTDHVDISTPTPNQQQAPLPPPPRRRVPPSTTPPPPASRLSVYPQNQSSLMTGLKTVWKRATTRVRNAAGTGRRRQQRESVVWNGFDRVVQYDVSTRPRNLDSSRAKRYSKRYSGVYNVSEHRDSLGTTRSSRIGVAL